ncbi:MAG: hypothetical protein HUU01_00055 [Saprospiraceae bacterium]|nr:hypothetical protein [Saprospiraceae bacterium]
MDREATNLFEAFPEISKAQWIEQIGKDLKGKPYADLLWQLEPDLVMEPFYHPDDGFSAMEPLTGGKHFNDWEVGESIDVTDEGKANTEAIEALMGGVNAPLFALKKPVDDAGMDRLLARIEPEYVSLHFGEYHSDKDPGHLFELLQQWVTRQGKDPVLVKASLDFDPFFDWSQPPVALLADMIRSCEAEWPSFKPLQVNTGRFYAGTEATSDELALSIAKGSDYLALLGAKGLAPELVNRHLQFAVDIGTSYFVQIAKIRALRLLWANVLAGYGVSDAPAVPIIAHFAKESQDENVHTNMIRAATQAMSAIIGGADRLYVLPAGASIGDEATPFHRRIARNVQHLLQLESHLGYVTDPAAGSYYIERLTTLLAEKAWSKFQDIEKNGGYLSFKGF